MRKVSVLLSANFDAAQLDAIRVAHPAVVVHGEAGGYAIEPPSGLDATEMTYPRFGGCGRGRHPAARRSHHRVPPAARYSCPCAQSAMGPVHRASTTWHPRRSYARPVISSRTSWGVHAIPLSETVLTMMLTLAKSWSAGLHQQRRKVWQRHIIGELHGKTVGIIGLGRVGREIARVSACLGMRVVAVRRSDPTAARSTTSRTSSPHRLHRMLAMSDFVVCAAPATPETYHLLGEPSSSACNPPPT